MQWWSFHNVQKNVEKIEKQKINERKKKRKIKTEKYETLIFYLIRKSIFSNFFHFVIFALTFMFNLHELILRIFFIIMYKNFDVLNMIDFRSFVEHFIWFNKTIFKTRRETTSSSKKRKKKQFNCNTLALSKR